MFNKILIPLDGSELSETSLLFGEELAGKTGSEIILYHASGHESQKQFEHMHRMYLDNLAGTIEQNLSKTQKNGKQSKVTIAIEAGEARENICNFVEKNGISLIILTAVGASGIQIGKTIGSVADHICRTMPIPVLLIRPQFVHPADNGSQLINHILLPLDGSALSRLAQPVAEEMAAELKASITLFQMAHIIVPDYEYTMSPGYFDYSKFSKAGEEQVRSEINALAVKMKEKSLDVTYSVRQGTNAADEIIEACKSIGADLIIMSTHGRSGPGRWILGSVSERVLHQAEVPLLLVHARAG
jgi:nucleotide-binding universal stress UspA family protein